MKFYDREKEIRELRRLDDLAAREAQLTVMKGSCRTGKTTLISGDLKDRKYLYFFIEHPLTPQTSET